MFRRSSWLLAVNAADAPSSTSAAGTITLSLSTFGGSVDMLATARPSAPLGVMERIVSQNVFHRQHMIYRNYPTLEAWYCLLATLQTIQHSEHRLPISSNYLIHIYKQSCFTRILVDAIVIRIILLCVHERVSRTRTVSTVDTF